MARTANIACRVDPAVKAAATRAAKDDHRSVASLVEKILVSYLRDAGYLDTPGSGNGQHSERPHDTARVIEAIGLRS